MDGDSLGIVHSRAERYVRNLESAPDRWHFDNETIYLIYGDRIDSVPFANNVAGETRVWASEDDEDVMALSAFLNINDTDRMPLEEDNINSQYRVAISLVPDYLIYEDQPRALQDVTQFMIHLAQNGYDPTTITAQFDVEHNEIDLLGISDFDYHQMVMLHEDLNRIMDDAPLNGYIYAIFTAPGIAEDFYPMTYGYPAARQAMMARSFLAEDHVFASTVRIEKTSGIIERIVAMQKALEASQLQERMIRVQYGIKHGLITSPEQAIATLAGVDDVRGAETDRKTDFKTHIKVGDTVRSYDFPFGSDTSCYVEGVVVRIAPAPSGICPCGLDHYHIVTQRRVFNDKETSDFAEAYFPVADPLQTRLEVVESKYAESPGRPKGSGAGNYTCGRCGKSGHNARTCDQPTPPKPLKPPSQSGVMRPSKSQQENLPAYRCGNCGVRGHNKSRCPEPAKIEVVDPRIIDDFEKWQSGESKLQAAGRIKRNILRILNDEPSGLGREQFIERYQVNTGTQSKQRKEVSKLTRTANKMTSDVILWRDRYYALGDGGKEAFFKTGPGSLRTDIVSQPPRSDHKCGNCGETGHHRNQCDKSENIWVPAPKPKLRAEE